jgi:ABC-type lipoprotein export system ATPase subunit
MGKKEIEITEKFKYAINQATKGRNLFITGRAGTGKSTLLRMIKEKHEDKKVITTNNWFGQVYSDWDISTLFPKDWIRL